MAAPTGTATLNKTTYAPGEKMTLTVTYSDPDTRVLKATVILEDAAGNKTAPIPVQGSIKDTVNVTVTDPERTWTKVSDDGAKAVYEATA